ncbi:MAG TPA: site-2 protease family protein [Gemmatimonadales bacterium]|nr:site-2 protease family protein [Gemmatimonadales bacterium]
MTASPAAVPAARSCARCGTELAPSLLSCPSCHALVHGPRLKELAAAAASAETRGDLTDALTRWREALELLPVHAAQHQAIATKLADLGRQIDAGSAAPKPRDDRPLHRRAWGAIIAVGLFALTKAKFLLLGLTKATTFWSMLLSFGIYLELWGWKFALGLVVSIYIHEMGHVAALRRYGIKATAPMFIPGIGALIRAKQVITDPRQDARVGLAGPLWGLGAALAAYGLFRGTGAQSWAAIAKMGGLLNLFNLLPVWQLDGAHGFRSLVRGQRWLAAAAIGAAWLATSNGLLVLLLLAAGYHAVATAAAKERDTGALATYVVLVWALSWLATLPVTTG